MGASYLQSALYRISFASRAFCFSSFIIWHIESKPASCTSRRSRSRRCSRALRLSSRSRCRSTCLALWRGRRLSLRLAPPSVRTVQTVERTRWRPRCATLTTCSSAPTSRLPMRRRRHTGHVCRHPCLYERARLSRIEISGGHADKDVYGHGRAEDRVVNDSERGTR